MLYFVFSDVHGFYDELMRELKKSGFDETNPEHGIISCGDLMDRGAMPRNCLKFVNRIPDERKILIRGNHEDLMEECLARKDFKYHDYVNGTAETICNLGDAFNCVNELDVFGNVSADPEWNKYRNSLVDYAEFEDAIFCHGWIPCLANDPIKYHSSDITYSFYNGWREGDWDRARWINGMDAWNQGVKVPGKTIYSGHWHTSWGHSKIRGTSPEWDNPYSINPEHRKADFSPFIDDGICAIDACTAHSHKINVVKYEAKAPRNIH